MDREEKALKEENALKKELERVRSCQTCALTLPFAPNPVLQLSSQAKILLIGQAPGTKAHESNLPFNDPSGDRLRTWMAVPREQFYNENNFALMPMGFCYPGRSSKGGDLPPATACAPLWHSQLRAYLPHIQLTLLIGHYAQAYYLKDQRNQTVTETVRAWSEYLPTFFPLPHPSWRNTAWCRRNPWFEAEVVPELRKRVHLILKG
jgi:uracil-DNA glycosylase